LNLDLLPRTYRGYFYAQMSRKGQIMPHDDETGEILQRLTRVETKLDLMINARDIANEALQSTKAGHKRLDKLEENQTWLWRTTIAALIIGAIGLLWKGVGH